MAVGGQNMTEDYSAEFIARQKRIAQSSGPWFTGDDVQEMFRLLEERSVKGDLDESELSEFLTEFKATHGKPA
jgi:hypothetical protein